MFSDNVVKKREEYFLNKLKLLFLHDLQKKIDH